MTLPSENILYKIFGVVNILQGRTRAETYLNYSYRLCFLLILFYAPRGVIGIQYNAVVNGNIVLSTKVLTETVTYWSTLYLSYINLLLRDGQLKQVKLALAGMEKTFRMSARKRRRQTFALWSIILGLLSCQTTYYTISATSEGGTFASFVCYFLNKFTVNLINYHLCCWLWVIHHLFEKLNRRLGTLQIRMKSDKFPNGHTKGITHEVYTIRHHHESIARVSKSLNDIYSIHIWLIVVNEVIETISSLSGLLFVAETCKNDHVCMARSTFLSLMWFLNFFVPVAAMVFSCSWVTDEIKKTGKLIHDIEIESSDELLTFILETFSLELYLKRFGFTGFGCFRVDKTLLLMNISTAVTYLIIQKQFAFEGLYASYTGF